MVILVVCQLIVLIFLLAEIVRIKENQMATQADVDALAKAVSDNKDAELAAIADVKAAVDAKISANALDIGPLSQAVADAHSAVSAAVAGILPADAPAG